MLILVRTKSVHTSLSTYSMTGNIYQYSRRLNSLLPQSIDQTREVMINGGASLDFIEYIRSIGRMKNCDAIVRNNFLLNCACSSCCACRKWSMRRFQAPIHQ